MRAGEVYDPGESEWEAKAWKTEEISDITKCIPENMERITRETRDRAGWRRLLRCAARHGRLIITPEVTAKEGG